MADVVTRIKVDTREYDSKIGQSKKKLDEFGKSGKSAGDALKEFSSKMGMSVGSLTAMTGAAGATALAFNTLKDAFFKNEQMLDEWGRTVESSKSLYSGFLNAINNGNISGYLTNINSIVSAARNAYDALDNLATFNAFNQINVEKGQTGFTEAMASFREGTGSKESVQAAGEEVKKQLRARAEFEKKAYQDEVNRIAAERGISGSILLDALSGSYEDYDRLKSLPMTGKKSEWKTNMYGMAYEVKSTVAANKEEELGNALRQLNDTELQSLQALGAQAQRTATEIAQVDKQMSRVLKETTSPKGGGGGGGKGGTAKPDNPAVEGTIRYYQEQITALNKQLGDAVSEDVRTQLRADIEIAQQELDKLNGKIDTGVKMEPGFQMMGTGKFNEFGEEIRIPVHLDFENIEDDIDVELLSEALDTKALDKFTTKWGELQDSFRNTAINEVASAFQTLGQAIGGTEGQVLSLIGSVAQQITQGVALISSLKAQELAARSDATAQTLDAASKTMNAHSWIPFVGVAMGVGMVASIIATLASMPKYADGGIVSGNNYSGDNNLVRVNSGELILNRAAQNNIANQLTQQNDARNNLSATLRGEDLILSINNTLARRGRGELATTR